MNRAAPNGGVYLTLVERYLINWQPDFAAAHIRPAGHGRFILDAEGATQLVEATFELAERLVEICAAGGLSCPWPPLDEPGLVLT